MEEMTVKTPSASTKIFLGEDCLAARLPALTEGQSNFVLTDSNVYALYAPLFKRYFADAKICVVEAGEQAKSLQTLQTVLEKMAAAGLKRNSRFFAVGGGVVGDLGGLCAALYMRGISYVQVPTTLLAQVDSSVGGKTAVNFGGVKNLIGAFYQPMEVLIDPAFLRTLPAREWKCGVGEIVKYAVLNETIKNALTAGLDGLDKPSIILPLLAECIRCKAEIVAKDEKESGARAALNIGHTTGHAMEAVSTLSHGECVLLGMQIETNIAVERGVCSKEYAAQLLSIVQAALALSPKGEGVASLLPAALQKAGMDKKNQGGGITMSVPSSAGEWASLTLSVQEYQEAVLRAVKE